MKDKSSKHSNLGNKCKESSLFKNQILHTEMYIAWILQSVIQHGKHVSIEAKSNQFLEQTGTVKRTLDLQMTNRLGSAKRSTDWDLHVPPASTVVGDGRRWRLRISPRRSLVNPSFWLKGGEWGKLFGWGRRLPLRRRESFFRNTPPTAKSYYETLLPPKEIYYEKVPPLRLFISKTTPTASSLRLFCSAAKP
jgi:hypothetical protein